MFIDPSKLCIHSQNFCVHCLWGRTANPHKDKEKEGLRLWQIHYLRESASLVRLPSWPFTSPGWMFNWCFFASAQSSHWLVTLHQESDSVLLRVCPDLPLWRLLRVSWTVRRSNQSILKEINSQCWLERLLYQLGMPKLKLQYFGHLMRRADSLEKTLMLRKTGEAVTEDEMVGRHHLLNGCEFEQT